MGPLGPNLDKLRKRGDVRRLIDALDHRDDEVRFRAALALGGVTNPVAFGDLVGALRHPRSDVRLYAALALGRMGDPRAESHLIHLLNDESGRARESAARALQALGSKHPISPVLTLTEHNPSLERAGLIRGISTPELTEDGVLYADAMLGDRDCEEHPDPFDELKSVSRDRIMVFSQDELAALALVAVGHEFGEHVFQCARAMDATEWFYGAIMRIAGALAHGWRHHPGSSFGAPTRSLAIVVWGEETTEARAAIDRQLAAGQPHRAVAGITEAALASWSWS